jgi:predicted dehydrogenase
MEKLRAGIIGCGFVANGKFLPSIRRVEGIESVAFCDSDPAKAQASAAKFGSPGSLICSHYQEVLSRGDIDVVFVCTPNNSHAEIAVAALESGKHVMCEKPMAKTAMEARAMLDAARATGRLLTIGYQNRFRPDSLLIKSLCERGDLGEIYFARALATRRRGVPTWGSFMSLEKQGGGPLIDLATHALDLTLWMMQNYEPVTVLGTTYNKIGKLGSPANSMGSWDPAKFEVEDSAFGMIRFKNGATVMVEASWALNMIVARDVMTLLCGTKGGADMFPPTEPVDRKSDFQPGGNFHVRVNGERDGKLFIQNYSPGAGFTDEDGRSEDFTGSVKEMQSWVQALRGEAELVVKPEEALVVTTILEAIYQSAQTGDVVHLA